MLLESMWEKLHRLCSQKKSLIPLCAQFKENYNYRNTNDDAHGNKSFILLVLASYCILSEIFVLPLCCVPVKFEHLKSLVNLIRLTLDSMTLSTNRISTHKINCMHLHTFNFCTLLVFLVKNERTLEMNAGDNN